jgi:hypothetical protein
MQLQNRTTRNVAPVALLAALLASIGSANAALDVSAVQTGITEALAAVTTVGIAVLGVIIAIKAYKWVRRAM